jgi:hypothetical protein
VSGARDIADFIGDRLAVSSKRDQAEEEQD